MKEQASVRELMKQGVLLFDGGMGTYFSEKERVPGDGCELANLEKPIVVRAIHREYLDAGARAVKTNTFAANRAAYNGDAALTRRVLRAGFHEAEHAAAPYGAAVFADIGPVPLMEDRNIADEYIFVLDEFLRAGARNFLFETISSSAGLMEAVSYLREKAEDAFVIVSFAVQAEGYTRDGEFGEDLLRTFWDSGLVDAVGMNCVCSAAQMKKLLDGMDTTGMCLSLMPNAGSPRVGVNRTFYSSDPAYFGEGLAQLALDGAAIVGGCCGTTPAHIAEAKRALRAGKRVSGERLKQPDVVTEPEESVFWEKLSRGQRVIAVELDPPQNADIRGYLEGAQRLRTAGADTLTIADCPIGRARMDSSMLAVKVRRDIGMEAIPHMTCRDRNMNAAKGLLLGLSADGIRNVLIVTGDPIPTAERDEVKSVYQFNSRKMAAFVRGLGEKKQLSPFHVFGALNVNAGNFDRQLELAKEKIRCGMVGLFTQPVLSPEALENLRKARETLDCRLMGGIMPVVSERNAIYMENEINGIHVDEQIIRRYHGLDRAAGEALGVELSLKAAEEMKNFVDGYYIMTPFNRVGMVSRIVAGIAEMNAQERVE